MPRTTTTALPTAGIVSTSPKCKVQVSLPSTIPSHLTVALKPVLSGPPRVIVKVVVFPLVRSRSSPAARNHKMSELATGISSLIAALVHYAYVYSCPPLSPQLGLNSQGGCYLCLIVLQLLSCPLLQSRTLAQQNLW